MRYFGWKFLLAGAAMVLAAGAALALKPSRVHQHIAAFDLEEVIPRSFGNWIIDPSIVPIAPTPDGEAQLDRVYSQVVSRTYVNARGEHVMLVVAHSGDQSDASRAHRQEVCYAAQGFEIKNVLNENLRFREKTIPVTRVVAVRGPQSEPVTYWFTVGDRVVRGPLERLLVQLSYGLSGRMTDGMLVRVSSISTHPMRAFKGHEEFVDALLGRMQQRDVQRLLGSGTS
jgi:EpsI family protein